MGTKVSLTEAASYLGVSKQTLRNWDKEGKVSAIRNPLNKYRLYDLSELESLKKRFEGSDLKETESQLPPQEDDINDGRTIKRTIAKINSILRDGDSNISIMSRFDEVSKLLFLKAFSEQSKTSVFFKLPEETDNAYFERLDHLYASAIESSKIIPPASFSHLSIKPETLVKCGNELSKIDISNSTCDSRGLAYEDMIRGTFDKNDNQQFFTPYQITEFMADLVNEFSPSSVCDPACGTAGFLTKIGASNPKAFLYGFEIDERLSWVSTMNLMLHGSNNFQVSCLQNGGSLGSDIHPYFDKMDAIITNPPFGSDYTDQGILSQFSLGRGRTSRRRGILFIEQAWNLLKNNGIAAIVIDQGVLNSKSAIDVRDFILSHFSILAIIDLPDSTFMPYANVSSSILLLRKVLDKAQSNHVFFAKSENVGRKSNGDEDYSYLPDGTAVQNNDLPKILEIWKDYVHGKPLLDVSFGCYSRDITSTLKEDDSHRLDYAFHHPFRSVSKELINESKYKLCTLSDLCEERNESYLTSSDPGTTSILFTGLADIESFTGIAHQVQTPSGSVKSAVKHYLPGDVVVSKMRPNLRKIAFMDFKQDGYVSSECSVFTIKRNKDGSPLLDPKLLSAILRSDYVFGQMMPYISGIGRPRISGSDLRKIKLPIPPKSIQDSALVSLNKSLSIAQELAKNAAELEEKAKQEELRGRNEVAKILSGAQNND